MRFQLLELEFVPIYCEKICKKSDPVVSKKLVMFVPLTHPRHSKISEVTKFAGSRVCKWHKHDTLADHFLC